MGIFFCLLGWKWRHTRRKGFMFFSGTKFLLESQHSRRWGFQYQILKNVLKSWILTCEG